MNKRLLAVFLCVLTAPAFAVVQSGQNPQQLQRRIVPGKVIVALHGQANGMVGLPESVGTLDSAKVLLRNERISIVEQTVAGESSLQDTIESLEALDGVLWAAPNYEYFGDPREGGPNDPKFSEQYHHEVMKNVEAWAVKGGSPDIVVAVTDDGFDLDHEDLKDIFWTNKNEIPNNEIDDDGNGYVDDVNAWDFSSDDNDPNPEGWDKHGTHVAGITAAQSDNKIGIAGSAAGVKIMPLRFYGSGSWTSSMILETYKYAADNGAHIITTSFNIDGFEDDKVFHEAVNYLYDKGVLQFNSAGNGNKNQSPRIKFTQLILACSTDQKDVRSSFSNYGVGVDLCAPGDEILSTIPSDKYQSMSGTSMASPNAAAVGAMIWSHNPSWSRDKVAAQLIGTCDNIDDKNKKFAGKLGAGRVNTYRALTDQIDPPTFVGVTAKDNTVILQTQSVFDAKLLNKNRAGYFMLRAKGGDEITLKMPEPYRIGTQELVFETGKQRLAPGTYEFLASSDLVDPFGTPMDDDFVMEIEIEDPTLAPMNIAEQLLSIFQG